MLQLLRWPWLELGSCFLEIAHGENREQIRGDQGWSHLRSQSDWSESQLSTRRFVHFDFLGMRFNGGCILKTSSLEEQMGPG